MMLWFSSLPLSTKILGIYFIIITIVTFFSFGFDKMKSLRAGESRVSERTLWILTFIGGSVGALAGMKYFRHKTKKVSFQVVIAIILVVQIWATYLFFR